MGFEILKMVRLLGLAGTIFLSIAFLYGLVKDLNRPQSKEEYAVGWMLLIVILALMAIQIVGFYKLVAL